MIYYESSLTHSGVKGQKKGRRRYQTKDGKLTNLGYVHYGYKNTDGTLTPLGKRKLHHNQPSVKTNENTSLNETKKEVSKTVNICIDLSKENDDHKNKVLATSLSNKGKTSYLRMLSTNRP